MSQPVARTITTVRRERDHGDIVSFLELALDDTRLEIVCGNTHRGTGATAIVERRGERFDTAAEAAQRLAWWIAQRGRHYPREQRTQAIAAAPPPQLAPHATDPALEAAVHAGTDGAALVYADWLQQHGDVRGDLAACFLAGNHAAAHALLAATRAGLFGDLAILLDSEVRALDWSRGFLTGASLRRLDPESGTDLADLARDFLALPVATFVTRLRFGLAGFAGTTSWTETMAAVAGARQATHIASLGFDDYTADDCALSSVPFGDFSSAWSRLPALEELAIRSGAGGDLGAIALPNLRRFVRESDGLRTGELESICAAHWPRLQHLEIWLGRAGFQVGGSAEALAPLLAGRAPATLNHLGLVNAELAHELIEPLARSALLPRLTSLDLSKGALQDRDIDTLLAHADAFAHLTWLDLGENQILERADEIAARLPNASVGAQRVDDLDDRCIAVRE